MTDVTIARQIGHEAAELAADHAERIDPGWKDDAFKAVCAFAARQGGEPFLAEDARAFAVAIGVCAPVEPRAWGNIITRAKREGFITPAGYAPAVSSRGSPKVLWRACLQLK